jgi:hypothetical protein
MVADQQKSAGRRRNAPGHGTEEQALGAMSGLPAVIATGPAGARAASRRRARGR